VHISVLLTKRRPTVADERKQDNHLIVVLQCDECGDPRVGCRDLACAIRSRPYAGEDVVPVNQQRAFPRKDAE
jgi:hypothetical protein